MLEFLANGFAVALTPQHLLYCFIGVLWGTVVGVLPGLGPLAGLTLLLPLTFKLDPAGALIMLAGIFYGAMYGGSTTSILLRIPGEAASVMTCIDGHEMAKQGRAGPALVVAAAGSFIGGTVSVVGLMLFAPSLAKAMLQVGPAAEFALMALALIVMSFVSSGPPLKTIAMILLGLIVATIGLDPITAYPRFTFGSMQFAEGISFVAMALGLFGISEILLNMEDIVKVKPISPTLRSLVPRWTDMRDSAPAIGRGTVIGFLFGFIPGISHVISTFVSYAVEKRISRHPETFGHGAIAGVAGPETANNATTGSAMVPLLVLGIPAIPATAILLSAMMIHGIQPGPQLVSEHPEVFWGLIASMYVGNLMLLVLNLPLVGLFVNLLRIPYAYLAPGVLLICVIGIYSVNANAHEILIMAVFGLLGYVLRKFKFDVAPLLLAVVLGDRIELSLRRALIISEGDYWALLQGAASRVIVGAALLLLVLQSIAWALGFRKKMLAAAADEKASPPS
ncbi:MAG TPA: tripartite tricarboxylate transporter permease [Casimicrobiaceae bacterium]|jgi:putative tricarboxylic transport membrane protein|nr:tripartite tricarboxylate transporter permease [Casimicrobiaceae bacterium]